jgi:hypothetical protein
MGFERLKDIRDEIIGHDFEANGNIKFSKDEALEILELIEQRERRNAKYRARYYAEREKHLAEAQRRYEEYKKNGTTYYGRYKEEVKKRRLLRELERDGQKTNLKGDFSADNAKGEEIIEDDI